MEFRRCVNESGIFNQNIFNTPISKVKKNQKNLKNLKNLQNLRNTINSFKNSYIKYNTKNELKLDDDEGIFFYIDKEIPIILQNNTEFKNQRFGRFNDPHRLSHAVISFLNNNLEIGFDKNLKLTDIHENRNDRWNNFNLNLNNNILTLKDNYKLYFSDALLSNIDLIVVDNNNITLFYNIDEKKFFIIYDGMNLYINENNESELLYYIIIYPKKYFFNKELILTQESLIREIEILNNNS